MDKIMQWAVSRILDIAGQDFFGSITLTFKAGKLIQIDHHRSEKPPEAA